MASGGRTHYARWRGAETLPGSVSPCVGWIYFIQGSAGGPIKIGLSRNPEKRLVALRRDNPEKDLVIRRVVSVHDGTIYRAEKVVHKQFAAYHLEGEWFRPARELAAVAGAIAE